MKRLQILFAALLLVVLSLTGSGQRRNSPARTSAGAIPAGVLLRIIKAEDERRWNDDLSALLADQDAQVRRRAALAAGRIGDERAVPLLADMVLMDRDVDVRQMAAFALGEIESPGGGYALTSVLKNTSAPGRARAVEALGKITAALASSAPAPTGQSASTTTADDRLDIFRAAILDALRFEAGRRSAADRLTVLLGLTAALRVKPEVGGQVIAQFLSFSDPRIRADALNTLSRLKFKDGNEQARKLLIADPDPIVRANAARVLGVTEDKAAFDALLDRATKDGDLRVRVSAIRSLGALKDQRAAGPLTERGKRLLVQVHRKRDLPIEQQNELLEIATTLGSVMRNTKSKETSAWLESLRKALKVTASEPEIAFARIFPETYVHKTNEESVRARDNQPLEISLGTRVSRTDRPILVSHDWRQSSAVARGLAEIAMLEITPDWMAHGLVNIARDQLTPALLCQTRPLLSGRQSSAGWTRPRGDCLVANALAVPDMLQALAALKPPDLASLLKNYLAERDEIIRATAAELIGNMPPDESNTRTLIQALPVALRDKDLNDAALAILDALGKQKNAAANDAIMTALNSSDHLLRRKAVALLKANGAGDFSARIGTVKTRNTEADYRRAIARIGKHVTATVVTSKGSFTIEFVPEEAPLTVDNFVQLARKGFFNGQTIPRVVPNFVVQAGDPRGDQNGGPGYQIRCEINEVPYERGAVGMALSGKDSGGSQWFVTHSPQPHLDGGYTVFARVISGMEVVDNIARGDIIRRVIVNEGPILE